MKVSCEKIPFIPVVITLESQFEVDVLKQLVGSVGGDRNKVRAFTTEIYTALDAFSEGGGAYFEGYLTATE
jgi:ABC-type amino acid transport substrate-binding protein